MTRLINIEDTTLLKTVMDGGLSAKALWRKINAQPEQKIGKFIRWMEKIEEPKYISYTPHCKCSLCENELLIENIKYCYMCGARLIEDREEERREE